MGSRPAPTGAVLAWLAGTVVAAAARPVPGVVLGHPRVAPSQAVAPPTPSVEVVGAALAAYAAGQGHRRIAASVDRPASTVRNWVRAFGRHAEQLSVLGTRRYHELDANATVISPAGSPAADALEALGLAARAAIFRFGPDQPLAVINVLTSGRLLTPRPARAGSH